MTILAEFIHVLKKDPMQLSHATVEVHAALARPYNEFVMVDGGAHKGWYTMRMAELPGCAAIYSVEADPEVGQLLRRNLKALSDAGWPKIHIVPKALQDREEVTEIPWMSSSSHVGRNSIRSDNGDIAAIWSEHAGMEYREAMSVPATTLDAILAQETRPVPVIKLDLEGADFIAMRGAQRILQNARPVVGFENAAKAPRVHGYTLADVETFFESVGYRLFDFSGESVSKDHWSDFHELWAVPKEKVEVFGWIIRDTIEKRLFEWRSRYDDR